MRAARTRPWVDRLSAIPARALNERGTLPGRRVQEAAQSQQIVTNAYASSISRQPIVSDFGIMPADLIQTRRASGASASMQQIK